MHRFRAILLALLALAQPMLSLAALARSDRCEAIKPADACCCCGATERTSASTPDQLACARECSQAPQRPAACTTLIGQTMPATARAESFRPAQSTPTVPAWTTLVAPGPIARDRATGVVATLRPPTRSTLCSWTT